MWHKNPLLFDRRRALRAYLYGTAVLTLSGLLVATTVWFLSSRPSVAVVPTLSGGSPANAATGVAVDAAITIDSDTALAAATVVPQWRTRAFSIPGDVMDLECASSSVCWATSDQGIFSSSDAGVSWSLQAEGQIGNADALHVISTTTAYVGDRSGTILKTTNGGTTWASQVSGTSAMLMDAFCLDTNTCWMVGGSGTILKTTNGGTTWTAQTAGSGYTNTFQAVHCIDANTCYAVGNWAGGGNGGEIQKTTNGGTTWTQQTSGVSDQIMDVHCFSATSCIALGFNNRILTTSDGTTWSNAAGPTTGDLLSGIAFIDANTGWIITDNSPGHVLKTTNGGTTWSAAATVTTSQGFFSVFPLDANTVVAGGRNGGSFRSTNGGTTWTRHTQRANSAQYALDCLDNGTTCWIAGLNDNVAKTTDGGATWTFLTSGTSGATFEAINFIDANTGWVVGNIISCDGSCVDTYRILKTTNGGTTWVQQATSATIGLYGLSCTDADTCYAVGTSGTILKTTNGGTSWSAQTYPLPNQTIRTIMCIDADTCYAAGADTDIVKTTNGGTTWTNASPGSVTSTFQSLACVDANTCTAVGSSGVVVRTTNGGTSWTSQTSGTSDQIEAVTCADANTCWAVTGDPSNRYTILATTDGGTTWSSQATDGTMNLWAVRAIDIFTVWAAGDRGTVRQYQTNVRLQTNTGNAQGGAPTGASLCTSVSLGNDGSGNANRRITCAHANLTAATWYTFTVTTGVTDTSGDALASNVARAFKTIGAPALVSASVADLALAQAATIVLTFDFDNPLAAATVTTTTVTLQTHGTNRRSASVSGSNLCTSVTLGNDGSGNENRRITCVHAALTSGRWHTIVITGGGSGIQSTGGQTMSGNVTRRLKVAHADGDTETIAASELGDMATEGWVTITTGDGGAAVSITALPQLTITATLTGIGTASVTLPRNAALTRTGGGTYDSSAVAMSDATSAVTNVASTVRAGTQFGIPSVGLTASAAVTLSLPIPTAVANGTELDVYRDTDTNFTDATTRLTTCTVASNACAFTTTNLSYFVAAEPAGAPFTDATPPAAPRDAVGTITADRATLTWRDPLDPDLRFIRVLRQDGDRSILRAEVLRGVQTYAERVDDLRPGERVTFGLQAQDANGNRSSTVAVTVTMPEPSPAATSADTPPTTTPSAPLSVGTQPKTSTSSPGVSSPAIVPAPTETPGEPPPVPISPPPATDRSTKESRDDPSSVVGLSGPSFDTGSFRAPPRDAQLVVDGSRGTLRWTDPPDPRLSLIRIVAVIDDARAELRGTVRKGAGTFTDDLAWGGDRELFVYRLIAVDVDGSTSQPAVAIGRRPAVAAAPPEERVPSRPVTTAQLLNEPLHPVFVGMSVVLADLTPPCILSPYWRSFLTGSFWVSQARAPSSPRDLAFLCGLLVDPRDPRDVTKSFPELRNRNAEELALRTFVNFFQRPPSRDFNGRPLLEAAAAREWWAVKYLAYHLRPLPTARDAVGERRCLRLFTDRSVDLYKDGRKVQKPAGQPPHDLWDYDFLHACTYSGAWAVEPSAIPSSARGRVR